MKFGFFMLLFVAAISKAQVKIGFKVSNTLGSPIEDAYVFINSKAKVTDKKGEVFFNVEKDNYTIKVNHIAYLDFSKVILASKDSIVTIVLRENKELLQEVVITAKESEGMTSSSLVDRKAMSHLQPSSFTDLVSLLPGKNITNSNLNASTHLRLREVGSSDRDYDTSLLGVSFLVDGVPINTNANLQQVVEAAPVNKSTKDYNRNTVRRGVDMRSISTDEIEKVEIVRGVASAKYGDLSSGLVKIKRKNGYTRWKSRIKSDGFSKLYSLGKGYNFNEENLKLNFDVAYLDAKADPRDNYENYKRYTTSLRLEKLFEKRNPVSWNLNVDYTGTVDGEKSDPDVPFDKYESFKSSYNSIRVSNEFNIDFSEGILKNINFKTSFNQSFDKIKQTRWVQLWDATALPLATEAGESYGFYLLPSYVSNQVIDGKPLDIFADFSGILNFSAYKIKNNITLGVNYLYAKNNGLGQVYDRKLPPSPSIKTRPRTYKEIPAMQSLAFYVEDEIKWDVNTTNFTLRAGVRGTSFLGLNKKYAIHNELFLDPRLNLKIAFPAIKFNNNEALNIEVTSGYGKHHKLPTLNMLYPQELYEDYEQLNYYHNIKEYRQVHYKTYKFSQVNYKIQPALNVKKEVRLGLNYDHHSLYITYFDEKMSSGFRTISNFHQVNYKKYDVSGLNHETITSAPLVENLPYKTVNSLALSSQESNGSSIFKKGVEFQYATKRIEALKTRFTINGAWLQSEYFNSLPRYKSETATIGGVNYINIGLYKMANNNSFKESLQTSFTADTYLQNLGLTTSFRMDVQWYTKSFYLPESSVPTHYVKNDGTVVPYTIVEANDPVLKSLILDVRGDGEVAYRESPLGLNTHIKISKKFYKNFVVSMYVNNLFNYYDRNTTANQQVTQRNFIDPYFGMELNFNF